MRTTNNTFVEHFPTKSAMLKFATAELKKPGATIKISEDGGQWKCETHHSSKCRCGDCK